MPMVMDDGRYYLAGNSNGPTTSRTSAKFKVVDPVKGMFKGTGANRVLYTWGYSASGSYGLEVTPAPVYAPKKTSTSKSSSSRKTTTASKPKPKPVVKPKPPAKPKVRKKPAEPKKKAGKAPSLVFTLDKPKLKEVIVPQAVPNPGKAPEFNFESRKEVTKYEYTYGIKHLEIKHKQYENKSIFVSKPIAVDGNAMQVSLHAIEEHPLFDQLTGEASDRQTSVEYYVSYKENPTQNEWHAILPEGIQTVKSELLMFTQSKTAKLRFPALIGSQVNPVVYKNHVALKKVDWSFADGATKVQLLGAHDPTAIYTIDYTPNAEAYNPWILDIDNQVYARTEKVTETFKEGTNHNKTILLSQYPYVDYGHINLTEGYDPNLNEYVPIKVRLKNASIAGPGKTTYSNVEPFNGESTQTVFTKNITDYKTSEWKEPKSYSLKDEDAYNGFEYWQEGNKLYFSETFNKADIYTNQETNHGNAEIEVEYEYMASRFRIKIILRRNSSDINTLSPIVHEYALKFKVMK
jgi:hypothetical protein